LCEKVEEIYQSFDGEPPVCCGQPMTKLISRPAMIRIEDTGGVRIHSKGYKEGYYKDYQRRLKELEERKSRRAKLAESRR